MKCIVNSFSFGITFKPNGIKLLIHPPLVMMALVFLLSWLCDDFIETWKDFLNVLTPRNLAVMTAIALMAYRNLGRYCCQYSPAPPDCSNQNCLQMINCDDNETCTVVNDIYRHPSIRAVNGDCIYPLEGQLCKYLTDTLKWHLQQ